MKKNPKEVEQTGATETAEKKRIRIGIIFAFVSVLLLVAFVVWKQEKQAIPESEMLPEPLQCETTGETLEKTYEETQTGQEEKEQTIDQNVNQENHLAAQDPQEQSAIAIVEEPLQQAEGSYRVRCEMLLWNVWTGIEVEHFQLWLTDSTAKYNAATDELIYDGVLSAEGGDFSYEQAGYKYLGVAYTLPDGYSLDEGTLHGSNLVWYEIGENLEEQDTLTWIIYELQ